MSEKIDDIITRYYEFKALVAINHCKLFKYPLLDYIVCILNLLLIWPTLL